MQYEESQSRLFFLSLFSIVSNFRVGIFQGVHAFVLGFISLFCRIILIPLGIYKYSTEKKAKKKEVNEAAAKILDKYRLQPPTSVSSTEDRQLRILSRFVNESTLCLQEGILASPVSFHI